MRPAIYKCPNHLECTVGYHGDDVEILGEMPMVCPECGTALVPLRRYRRSVVPVVINLLLLAGIGIGIWLAWPKAVYFWKRFTTPPAENQK